MLGSVLSSEYEDQTESRLPDERYAIRMVI